MVLGPTRDIINITHGPIGCGFYSWLTRRNQTDPDSSADGHNFMPYCFSTDMQDEEIIFGGEKKLKQAIQEAYDNFKPKAIAVFSTCPVGLIGDDVHAVCREMKDKLGINIFGFSCEGYKGVSQSAGHHIANNGIFKHVVGLDDTVKEGKYRINLLGEYNIGGDAFEIERLFERCGITLVSSFSGNSSIDAFANSHTADLNLIMCHRSINYVAEMMETKFGVPWIKVNFIGAAATAKSLRKIARYFDEQELTDNVEAGHRRRNAGGGSRLRTTVRPRTEGKRAMLFVGGSRAHHYQELFSEMGMKTLSAGYEFGHRDDYEGRKVLPDIKVDADSRNIEEMEITPDPDRFKPRISEAKKSGTGGQGAAVRRLRRHDDRNAGRHHGDRRSQPVRNRPADQDVQAGHLLCRHQGKIHRAETRHSLEAAAQLRLRRALRRFQRGHQFLQGNRPHGQQPGVAVHARPWQEHPELAATYAWE